MNVGALTSLKQKAFYRKRSDKMLFVFLNKIYFKILFKRHA